ncbi:hypothetical protein EOA19_04595 [Mesorhizobium sp. M7A.F.Ca.US.010.02.1.1]|nr:hypothetical protein EOA19_04595 [Mesorhizobium sp. M7A.F.Ca.US.010.02.1.1]
MSGRCRRRCLKSEIKFHLY